jgi:hypothetical protein
LSTPTVFFFSVSLSTLAFSQTLHSHHSYYSLYSLLFYFTLLYFFLLLCRMGVHCGIYKGSYTISNTSYLSSPPPPFLSKGHLLQGKLTVLMKMGFGLGVAMKGWNSGWNWAPRLTNSAQMPDFSELLAPPSM